MKRVSVLSLAAVGGALLTGCATMDRGYQGMTRMTNPDKMVMKGGVKWMNPHPALREVRPDKMVVYLRLKNSSGGPLDTGPMAARVREELERAGYRVTSNIDEAQFTVRGDLRFYGENASNDGGAGVLTGAVLGGVGGAVAGRAIHSTNTSTGLGAAAGAAIGAWFANIMANRNKMVEIDVVMDLRVGERIKGGVTTTRRSDDKVHVQHSDTTAIPGGGHEGGAAKGGSSEAQEVMSQDDFLYHQNRLVAHAVKMQLTPEEAMPFLSGRVAAALGGVLP